MKANAPKGRIFSSHIRTTQRYAHQSPEHFERQIGLLDDFISPPEKSVEFENMAVGE